MEFIIFILGLSIGSFLNVLVERIPKNESFIKGRSHCDFCRHKLSWYDLIPVVSFIFLKGRCRYCLKSISLRYPFVEIVTAISYLFVYLNFSSYNLQLITYNLIIISGLIIIFFTDFKYRIIPDPVLIPLIILVSIYDLYVFKLSFIYNYFPAAFLFSGLFLFLVVITKGKGMGLGDVKYAFFMGLLLGFPNIIISFYIAFLTGAFISLILVLKGKKSLKSKIAFGPFLVMATFVTMFWGNELWMQFKQFLGI